MKLFEIPVGGGGAENNKLVQLFYLKAFLRMWAVSFVQFHVSTKISGPSRLLKLLTHKKVRFAHIHFFRERERETLMTVI